MWHFDARATAATDALVADAKRLREECDRDAGLGYELTKRIAQVVIDRLQATQLRLRNFHGERGVETWKQETRVKNVKSAWRNENDASHHRNMTALVHTKAIAQWRTERAHDILRAKRPIIDIMFAPKSVAVIGATEREGSVGRMIFENLKAQPFAGAICPVNPNHARVLGSKAYPHISDVPVDVDLAVAVTPAATVPGIISECAKARVKGVVIISAGFKETGAEGIALERRILANRGTMRIIGPNCLGVMIPHAGLNATFAAGMAKPGNVAFLSQSGALFTAILDWSLRENVGFSAFVSIGSMLDVSWGDLIYQLGDDPHTKSIIIYMETIGDARAFLSAAREVALTKPIIVIKVGRTAAAAKAAVSHTGSMTGSDEVLDAAFQRAGVLRVDTIAELFDMAEVLAKQPRPRGPRLAIVTNAGGPGGLATDMLVGSGGEIATLSPESFNALNEMLPAHWSRNNPVDILGDASAERYARSVEILQRDPNTDGVLVILAPQAMTDPTATAEEIRPLAQSDKPLLAAWMGGPAVDAGETILNEAHIPSFKYPDRAARAFAYAWRYSLNLRALYETPALGREEDTTARRATVRNIIETVQKQGRRSLPRPNADASLPLMAFPLWKRTLQIPRSVPSKSQPRSAIP